MQISSRPSASFLRSAGLGEIVEKSWQPWALLQIKLVVQVNHQIYIKSLTAASFQNILYQISYHVISKHFISNLLPRLFKTFYIKSLTASFQNIFFQGSNEYVVKGSCEHELLVNPDTGTFFKENDSCSPEEFR